MIFPEQRNQQVSPLSNRRNFDGRDKNCGAFKFGVALGDDADGGEFVFTKFIVELLTACQERLQGGRYLQHEKFRPPHTKKKCQQKCQQNSSVGSKMELRKVGWSLLDLNHKRL